MKLIHYPVYSPQAIGIENVEIRGGVQYDLDQHPVYHLQIVDLRKKMTREELVLGQAETVRLIKFVIQQVVSSDTAAQDASDPDDLPALIDAVLDAHLGIVE